jgi:hypothetical protein
MKLIHKIQRRLAESKSNRKREVKSRYTPTWSWYLGVLDRAVRNAFHKSRYWIQKMNRLQELGEDGGDSRSRDAGGGEDVLKTSSVEGT